MFNYIIDESTLKESFSIVPETDFSIHTSQNRGISSVSVLFNQLENDTEYTITIDKSLKDLFGNSLDEGFQIKFVTIK